MAMMNKDLLRENNRATLLGLFPSRMTHSCFSQFVTCRDESARLRVDAFHMNDNGHQLRIDETPTTTSPNPNLWQHLPKSSSHTDHRQRLTSLFSHFSLVASANVQQQQQQQQQHLSALTIENIKYLPGTVSESSILKMNGESSFRRLEFSISSLATTFLLLTTLQQSCQAFSPIHQVEMPPNSHFAMMAPSSHPRFFIQPSLTTFRSSRSKCYETRRFFDGNDEGGGGGGDDNDSSSRFIEQLNTSSGAIILLAPAAMAVVAFSTYTQVATGFHSFVDVASGHTWAPVDGGAYLTDLITPALTGPVASFISLLFGTLTSMTVGQLYNRQANMSRLLGDLLEDLRLAELHMSSLPTLEYRKRGRKLIQAYGALLVDILEQADLPNLEVKQRREAGRRVLEQNVLLLHRVSGDKAVADQLNGRALDEAYGTLNRLVRTRSSLITTYENSFPIWHYGNLCILAMAILFIFLVLTDKTALLFLGGFQLRMCWSMLIGTLSMLVVVIYDLNSPLSGTFRVIKPMTLVDYELDEIELDKYVDTFGGENKININH